MSTSPATRPDVPPAARQRHREESHISASPTATPGPADPRPHRSTRDADSVLGSRDRRPTGRERHDEKITVYVSSSELFDLEQARLVLRGEHGLAVDRGRIVREAVAFVLADLDAQGASSILVRKLVDG